jgi:hypothetical protein
VRPLLGRQGDTSLLANGLGAFCGSLPVVILCHFRDPAGGSRFANGSRCVYVCHNRLVNGFSDERL